MNWKVKAFIQNFLAKLPGPLSYEIYFQMQRYFGGLKKPLDPSGHFSAAAAVLKKIQKHGGEITGKTFFEVGTGRAPLLPAAFWLCGADKTITADLNPYMRDEIIKDMLFCIKTKTADIKNIFGGLLQEDRFRQLLEYGGSKKINRKDFLKMCRIEYAAPADAAETLLENNSIHYHVSHTVYEHIPLNIIKDILDEGGRIISPGGMFINHIDYGDHFSYMDKNISVINFLRYNDREWERCAGNRYMYMNRARHDDFLELFREAGHEFIEIEPYRSKEAEELLKNGGIALDKRYKEKGNEVLSITGALLVTRKSYSRKNGT